MNSNRLLVLVTMPIAITILISTFLFDMASGGQISPLIASTRGLFNPQTGEMSQERYQEFLNAPNILGLDEIGNCPGEISIYVHGIWSSEEEAEEQVDRVNRSLKDSGYQVLLVGFSWDSDTQVSPAGWRLAKEIANTNGHKLAELISSFKDICPQDSVRIIAHSLGARVTLAALQDLYENPAWNNVKVTSVHLMGAAVDDEQISLDPEDCIPNTPALPCSGQAIESQVQEFFNLHNPMDNVLETAYIFNEGDLALGHWGAGYTTPEPRSYNEENVLLEIAPLKDADGNGKDDCFDEYIIHIGDNHCGYMGHRTNPWYNGAIDIVARDWRS